MQHLGGQHQVVEAGRARRLLQAVAVERLVGGDQDDALALARVGQGDDGVGVVGAGAVDEVLDGDSGTPLIPLSPD